MRIHGSSVEQLSPPIVEADVSDGQVQLVPRKQRRLDWVLAWGGWKWHWNRGGTGPLSLSRARGRLLTLHSLLKSPTKHPTLAPAHHPSHRAPAHRQPRQPQRGHQVPADVPRSRSIMTTAVQIQSMMPPSRSKGTPVTMSIMAIMEGPPTTRRMGVPACVQIRSLCTLQLGAIVHDVVPKPDHCGLDRLEPRRLPRPQAGHSYCYHDQQLHGSPVFPNHPGAVSWYGHGALRDCHVLTDTGPTITGSAPFLAESNPAPFGTTGSFVANTPLETALPIVGDTTNASIFHLMGQLSPYFPNPRYVCYGPVSGMFLIGPVALGSTSILYLPAPTSAS